MLKQILKYQQQIEELHEKIATIRKNRTIRCASCKQDHAIKDLVAIQTHWYVSPTGCTGGDYWQEGELQFICPETNVINRLLFQQKSEAENKFRSIYKSLFKEVIQNHGKTEQPWINNFFVDKNMDAFEI